MLSYGRPSVSIVVRVKVMVEAGAHRLRKLDWALRMAAVIMTAMQKKMRRRMTVDGFFRLILDIVFSALEVVVAVALAAQETVVALHHPPRL